MSRARSLLLTLVAASVILSGRPLAIAAQDLDCASFESRAAAQRALEANPAMASALDEDGDGLACEDLFDPESGDAGAPPAPSAAGARPDIDCRDLVYQEIAQQVLARDRSDPFNLDPTGDGVACSSLPSIAGVSRLATEPVAPAQPLPAAPAERPAPADRGEPAPEAPAEAAQPTGSRLKAGLNSASGEIDAFWASAYGELGGTYTSPGIRMFRATVETQCGPAETGVGPVYCPLDQTIYIDMPIIKEIDLFQDPFVMRAIFAHEWAHHIQFLSGYEVAIFPDERGEVLSLQLELHADCLAGVWARSAVDAGVATEDDLLNAMTLAYASGDAPETPFLAPDAHGTGEMRLGAFVMGLEHGKPKACEREILKLL